MLRNQFLPKLQILPLLRFFLYLLLLMLAMIPVVQSSSYSWMSYDRFDEVNNHVSSINGDNCRSKSKEDLALRPDTVNQLPVYNKLFTKIWYKNRTNLVHLHNMALNRAFFFSYVLQRMNDSSSFYQQPNWLYLYMSTTADVNANPNGVNGSAVFFDTHCYYPNWYQTVPFNNTLPLFGPKAWTHDDYRDQDNFLREPTRQVAMVADLGAGKGMNYTHHSFKMNPWYGKWLPDLKGDMDSLTKFTYYVGVKYSNSTGSFTNEEYQAFSFSGPSSPSAEDKDERMLPVVFTQPYFDCGRSNKWVVSTVSPVIDFMPRYSNWTHLRRQRVVAAVVMDIDFQEVDFNACSVGKGNPGPSYLSGIHRCRKTTNCRHTSGKGFQRGGYKCNCRSGLHWPWQELKPSWDGVVIEQATDKEYYNSFKCLPTDYRQVLPNQVDQLGAVDVEGGSNTLTSGGLDNSQLVKGMETVPSRTRRSINDTQRQHLLQEIASKLGQRDAFHQPQPARAPYGVYADIQASHDRKIVTEAEKEDSRQRRLQDVIARRRNNPGKTSMDMTFGNDSIRRTKRASLFDAKAFDRMMRIFRHKDRVKGDNCHQMAPHNLVMASDVAYGVEKQFEPKGGPLYDCRISSAISYRTQTPKTTSAICEAEDVYIWNTCLQKSLPT